MLIALIADIHANMLALRACLDRVTALRAEKIVFLGDLVGYGAEPEETVETIRSLHERGATVIRGNHDQAAFSARDDMNETARLAIQWTRENLSDAAKNYLASLPMTAEENGCLYVHAEASAPASWKYVTSPVEARASLAATHAAITFCGHVHVPALYCVSATGKLTVHAPTTDVAVPTGIHRQWLAVIGSAGQPRDGNPAAAFATYDTAERILTFRRVSYDAESAAARVRDAGLPDVLAQRLLRGR
jgi:diadenosine tetraphosphatase ApaH/serine/threonine PP2A family protein phosphatase